MSDGLKQHIDQNKDTFEVYPFDIEEGLKGLFAKLGKQHHPKKRRIWYGVAASIVILITAWLGLGTLDSPSHMSSEFRETQFYYQDMIDAKLVQVKDQIQDPGLLEDIAALDDVFIELRSDLKEDVDNEEVLTAMIDNYRLKLKILERILEELEEKDDEKALDI